jgi:dihydroflavonol-4-reductase
MTKVTVTGASGHLGANLVRELLRRGHEVRALVRQSDRALKGLPVDIVQGDVLDRQSLQVAFRGAQVVYHLAAFISIEDGLWNRLESVNVQGTHHVIEACKSESVKTLVHFSSVHALEQRPMDRPVDEDRPLFGGQHGRGHDYDISKAEADRLIREVDHPGLSTRTVYPTAVIGPCDYQGSLMGEVIQKLAKGRLPALVSGGFDWVDARDVAAAAINTVEAGDDKSRFLLSGHYRTMRQFAQTVSELTGVPAPRLTSPIWLARASAPILGAWASLRNVTPLYTRGSMAALAGNRQVSHALAAQKLAYKPRRFKDSVSDALSFYQHGEDAWIN